MITFKIYNILSIIILPSVNKQINKNVTRSILGSLTHLIRSPVAFFGFPSFYNHIVLFRLKIHRFTFSSVFAIIVLHRVAFLRKSSCRSATLFLKEGGEVNDKEQFYRQIVLQKCVSPDLKELTHFLFF